MSTEPKSDTRYRLHVVKSEIAWDMPVLFGIPSPFIEISLAGQQPYYVTTAKPRTITPVWNEFLELKSNDPTSVVSINLRRTSMMLGPTRSIGSTQLSIEELEVHGTFSPDISLDLFQMNKKTAVVIIRFRKDDVHHSNTDLNSLQNGTVAKENAELKMHCQWQLEAGRHDLANLKAIKQTRDLQGENQKLEDELNILKGTLRGVQDKHLHTVKLLEERTADWKAAQTFLTTVDRYAGAEIMKMVDDLNDEIFQGAGLVSELLGDGNAFEVDERRKNAQLTQGDRDNLTQFIGPKLLEHLSTTKWKQLQVDPFPLQLAVQAILTRWCVFMVDSFYPGPASNDLKEIYRRIWESEPQAVAGRWRAMMAKQAKHLDSATRKDVVIKMLLNLLCLCGSPMANVASPSQQTSLCLHEVVSTISNMWMQLRTAIQEGVTTTEMKIFDANPNDIYQDEVMNDIYSDPKDVQQAEHILCAVGMGLHRSVIRRNGDGIMSIQRDITLKAKVAFPSVLFDSA